MPIFLDNQKNPQIPRQNDTTSKTLRDTKSVSEVDLLPVIVGNACWAFKAKCKHEIHKHSFGLESWDICLMDIWFIPH